jgi:nucleoside-diphosphate-sugar epimerase
MRVLVTGGAGYIGTPLCTTLARTHEVTCWDPGLFGFNFDEEPAVTVVPRRVQELDERALAHLAPDWVIHLSGLSNDPMANFAPRMNHVENTLATEHVGALTEAAKIPLILASSASVYGFNESGALAEDAPVAPIGHYSVSKAAAERVLLDRHHHPVILRQATVMGVSPRMRWDLLTNGMTRTAWATGRLCVLYGGRETRPQIHLADLCEVYRALLATPDVPAGVYNVGATNDSVMALARAIREQVSGRAGRPVELDVTDEPRQHRSYALLTDKLASATGFRPRRNVSATVDELCAHLARPDVDPQDPRGYNIRWMKLLYEAQAILERSGPIDPGGEVG